LLEISSTLGHSQCQDPEHEPEPETKTYYHEKRISSTSDTDRKYEECECIDTWIGSCQYTREDGSLISLTRYDRDTVTICIVEVFGGKKRSLLLTDMVEEICSPEIKIDSESDITDSTDHRHV
jgi:hypothetical protein